MVLGANWSTTSLSFIYTFKDLVIRTAVFVLLDVGTAPAMRASVGTLIGMIESTLRRPGTSLFGVSPKATNPGFVNRKS